MNIFIYTIFGEPRVKNQEKKPDTIPYIIWSGGETRSRYHGSNTHKSYAQFPVLAPGSWFLTLKLTTLGS